MARIIPVPYRERRANWEYCVCVLVNWIEDSLLAEIPNSTILRTKTAMLGFPDQTADMLTLLVERVRLNSYGVSDVD